MCVSLKSFAEFVGHRATLFIHLVGCSFLHSSACRIHCGGDRERERTTFARYIHVSFGKFHFGNLQEARESQTKKKRDFCGMSSAVGLELINEVLF